jgi:hypothetical protein
LEIKVPWQEAIPRGVVRQGSRDLDTAGDEVAVALAAVPVVGSAVVGDEAADVEGARNAGFRPVLHFGTEPTRTGHNSQQHPARVFLDQ